MKTVLFLITFFICHFSYSQNTKRVLILIKEESSQLEFMLENEALKMRGILKQSGFEVFTATVSGKTLRGGSVSLTPDLKLSQVDINDYDGFIIPCMIVDKTTEETVEFVKNVVKSKKPIAAQVASVYLLAEAGALKDKEYALYSDQSPKSAFEGSTYAGNGVVKDGKILTSGGCPWAEYKNRGKDRTVELTEAFMDMVKALR
ncbi:DJ-1/PfpI family protein [Carboxylicivirga sp. M1479]|uniref:DJ-1/PfpI family protein n=1 Tax=Carboxylicivirga sp. M1479 TaxID=2594476 RepID=UPI001177AAD8|nr:DJ-1/PfpI family protein [Carboxylicivirga sp. M1479]TRX72414.1 DJ-1/PfpI family protein [Carboxylicivirga sp. M1479]